MRKYGPPFHNDSKANPQINKKEKESKIYILGESSCCQKGGHLSHVSGTVFTHVLPSEHEHTPHTQSHPRLCSGSIRGQWFRRFLDFTPGQTTGLMAFFFPPRLPPMSCPKCQLGWEQMGWFSMVSHQPTQWHVKQAGLCQAQPYCITTGKW